MNKKELESKASHFAAYYVDSNEIKEAYIAGFLAGRDAAAKLAETSFITVSYPANEPGSKIWNNDLVEEIKALGENPSDSNVGEDT